MSDSLIYSHGYSVRVAIHLPHDAAESILHKLGWKDRHQSWRRSEPRGGTRWQLRGSGWLTGHKPRQGTAIAGRNKTWMTKFAKLSVQKGPEAYHLDIEGKNRPDIDYLMEIIMGLQPEEWSVVRWRKLERYVALSPREAMRVAALMGGTSRDGAGRMTRKQYRVEKDIKVPIRQRASVEGQIEMYRVNPERGATHVYKLEIRLRGRTSRRGQFSEDEGIKALDSILLDLIDRYQIQVIEKPARWEPRDHNAPIEHAPQDPSLQGLIMKAYRGPRPSETKCNTPPALRLVDSTMISAPYPPQTGIRNGIASSKPRRGEGDIEVIKRKSHVGSHVEGPWSSLAKEVAGLPTGILSEVIMDVDQCPRHLLTLLGREVHGMGVTILTDPDVDTPWPALHDLVLDYPANNEGLTHLAIVVAPDILVPLTRERWGTAIDIAEGLDPEEELAVMYEAIRHSSVPRYLPEARLLSDALASAAREWRELCESTGLSIILVTPDARTAYGRGPWRPPHRWKDTRVRSLMGNASRYYSHVRIRVDEDDLGAPLQVVYLKDEVQGLGPGRVVWKGFTPPQYGRWEIGGDHVSESSPDLADSGAGSQQINALVEECF